MITIQNIEKAKEVELEIPYHLPPTFSSTDIALVTLRYMAVDDIRPNRYDILMEIKYMHNMFDMLIRIRIDRETLHMDMGQYGFGWQFEFDLNSKQLLSPTALLRCLFTLWEGYRMFNYTPDMQPRVRTT